MVNDLDEAKVYYRRCISLDPRNDEAFYGLGCCLLVKKNMKIAFSLGKGCSLKSQQSDYTTLMEAIKNLVTGN